VPFLHYFTSSRAVVQDNHLHPFFIHQLKYSVYILVCMYDDAKKGMFEMRYKTAFAAQLAQR